MLLGIVFLGILGCFLYYYRPRNLMKETRFKQVLRWSESGKLLFVGESLFLVGGMCFYFFQIIIEGGLQYWMELHDMDFYSSILLYPLNSAGGHPSSMAFVAVSIFLPFFLACLTQWKLVKPLNEEKVPSQKWFHLLRFAGLSSVVFLQVFSIALPWLQSYRHWGWSYTPDMLLYTILGTTLFLSSQITGTLCLAVAKHKSKSLLIDSSYTYMKVTNFKIDAALRWFEYGMLSVILSIFSAALVLYKLYDGKIYFIPYFQDLEHWTIFFWTISFLVLLTHRKILNRLRYPENPTLGDEFRKVLRWLELSKFLLIGQSIFVLVIAYIPMIQAGLNEELQIWMEQHNPFLYPHDYLSSQISSMALLTVLLFLPLLLAWLIHKKLSIPLSKERLPSHKWFNSIFMMGLLLLVFVEVFTVGMALFQGTVQRLGYEALASNLLGVSLFFSSLTMGMFAVGMAQHKLARLPPYLNR